MVRTSTPHQSLRTARLLPVLCLTLVIGAGAVGAVKSFIPTLPPDTPPAAGITPHPLAGQQQGGETHLSVELVTITPRGFEPNELSPSKGRFILAVDNRSGMPDVELRLLRETGQRLHEVRVPRELADWSDVLDLHPGRYVLTVAERPDWSCAITVSSR